MPDTRQGRSRNRPAWIAAAGIALVSAVASAACSTTPARKTAPTASSLLRLPGFRVVLMASGGGTGYFFENGVHYGIGSLAGLTLHAAALNDSGWIGGSDGSNRPAIWNGDSLRVLPAPDSTMTTGWVIALNEAGEAIGLFGNYMTIGKPILLRPDTLIVLGPYIDYKIYPIDINNRSQLVLDGSYYYSFQNNSYSSFFWENGTHTRIMHPYGPEYYYRLFARAINDNGIIVLSGSQTYSDGESIMYVWESGLPAILSSLPPYNRINPSDINNSGSIVGGLKLKEEGTSFGAGPVQAGVAEWTRRLPAFDFPDDEIG